MDKVEDIVGGLFFMEADWRKLSDLEHEATCKAAIDLIQSQQALIEEMREALYTISGMNSWQCGVPIDSEAANEHARIASEMANIAGVAASLSQRDQIDG